MTSRTDPKNLASMVDRQVQLWELRQRQALDSEAAGHETVRVEEGPWLTISKQLGSGGIPLAHAIAERRGWQVFDKEFLESVSRHGHICETVLKRMDERKVGWFEDTVSRFFMPEDPGQAPFRSELMKVMVAVARQGRAVLLGRGANWLLDPSFGLRVRVIAPAEMRIDCLVEARGIDHATARLQVLEDDAAKAGFVRQVFRRNIDDSLGYDMVINMAQMTPEAAVDAVVAVLDRKL